MSTSDLTHLLDSLPHSQVWATHDKSKWMRGEWDDEPDKIEWRDPDTNYPCLIVRSPSGALCGYVGVPTTHRLHGLEYDEANDILTVHPHGSLTFADHCDPQGADDPSRHICHIPLPGEEDDVWWLGFDCAHYNDLCPGFSLIMPDSELFKFSTYRNVAYVVTEVTVLAEELFVLNERNES